MDRLTFEDLQSLIEPRSSPCVSIYLPMVRAGREVRQNPIRYRNLLARAEDDARARYSAGDELFREARALAERPENWEHSCDGLAVLFGPEEFRVVRSGVAFDELAVVSHRYHLKPLLGSMAGDQRFHLLDLNRHHVRLFDGGRDGMREIDPDGLKRDYRDVVGRDREEPHLQFHTGAASAGAVRDARFHGQGGGDDDVENELRRFVAELEPVVRDALADSGAPLLLAGIPPMPALYRERNRYPRLADEEIHRNVSEENEDDLHRIAWPVARRIAAEHVDRQAERLRSLLASDQATAELPDVVAAADDGRVDVLFVARGERRWGTYDRASRRVVLHDGPRDDSDDLLDLAAVRTFACSGTVLVVDPEEVPGPAGTPAAAALRYPGAGATGG